MKSETFIKARKINEQLIRLNELQNLLKQEENCFGVLIYKENILKKSVPLEYRLNELIEKVTKQFIETERRKLEEEFKNL